MFLIEYKEGGFINGKSLNWASIEDDQVLFTLEGSDRIFTVSKGKAATFVNNIGALDGNGNQLERSYCRLVANIYKD